MLNAVVLAGGAFPRPCMWDLNDLQIKKASLAPLSSAYTDEVGTRTALCLTTKTDFRNFPAGEWVPDALQLLAPYPQQPLS